MVAFKATADWIRNLRRSERLHDYLAQQEITWKFNVSKAAWWGAIYERLIKDIKGVLHKILGRTKLSFAQLETIVLDIERHMNNRPLTYVESEVGEDQVLTPNVIMWGQNSNILEDIEVESESLTKFQRRLQHAREHVWRRWSREYVRSLMEQHRMKRSDAVIPGVGEIVLVAGEQKNRGIWMKGKVLHHIKGRDGIVREAVLLHKGHEIERPLELLCPLEIRSAEAGERVTDTREKFQQEKTDKVSRPKRVAAKISQLKTQLLLEED